MRLSEQALSFATVAHDTRAKKPENRFRKYTGEPYINHPMAVVTILADNFLGLSENVVAAALLHDVLEDTTVTEQELRDIFGDEVTNLVLEVTDVSKPTDGNRKTRKALDAAHLGNASPWGQNIKLADIIDNGRSIAKHDPKFANVFRREKNDLLTALLKGDSKLWHRALQCMTED